MVALQRTASTKPADFEGPIDSVKAIRCWPRRASSAFPRLVVGSIGHAVVALARNCARRRHAFVKMEESQSTWSPAPAPATTSPRKSHFRSLYPKCPISSTYMALLFFPVAHCCTVGAGKSVCCVASGEDDQLSREEPRALQQRFCMMRWHARFSSVSTTWLNVL